ncbi:MAG: divalent-cation tolerance protein CutA [Nitrososphaerota archaeon]
MPAQIVLTTYPDREGAKKAARSMVERRLAACANIMKVRSIYVWKGRLEDTEEYLVILKTLGRRASRLVKAIKEGHPYEVPEAIVLPISSIDSKYLGWLKESLGGRA